MTERTVRRGAKTRTTFWRCQELVAKITLRYHLVVRDALLKALAA